MILLHTIVIEVKTVGVQANKGGCTTYIYICILLTQVDAIALLMSRFDY